MPCYHPLTAYYAKVLGPTGKRAVTFSRNGSFSGVPIRLPCGQCVGCRLERSRQWAVRCMHEKQLHDDNVFVTLTYDQAHLPPDGTLVKRDLVLFMKRLRKARGAGVRFYACGEYGDRTRRPHYHLLLFNCWFPDRRFYKLAKRGEHLFTSEELRKLWPMGHNVIGDVTFESAAYVARYIMEKRNGDVADQHYNWVDSDGVCHGVIPEFTVMSRRPGIGYEWFRKFGRHAFNFDSVVVEGREIRPPRFYDTKFEILEPEAMAALKVKRRRQALLHRDDNTPERRRVREQVEVLRLAQARRGVDDY